MTSLIERIEAADSGQQRAMLVLAFKAVFPTPYISATERAEWEVRSRAFQRLLNAEAFLDAAMTLVSEGHEWTVNGGNLKCRDSAAIGPVPARGSLCEFRWVAEANSPACALSAAALRARGIA